MKERPIPFTAEMVRAILEGRKTMTRRLVKPQGLDVIPFIDADNNLTGEYGVCTESLRVIGKHIRCPYGKPGDRLWVKETWRPKCMNCEDDDVRGGWYGVIPEYQADDAQGKWIEVDSTWWEKAYADGDYGRKWRNSRFMPRWASRILLEIVSVRVERVQDISGEDAWQEGVACTSWSEEDWVDSDGYGTPLNGRWDKAHEDFAELWDTIHAKKPESKWDANPWVWVIEFKVVMP